MALSRYSVWYLRQWAHAKRIYFSRSRISIDRRHAIITVPRPNRSLASFIRSRAKWWPTMKPSCPLIRRRRTYWLVPAEPWYARNISFRYFVASSRRWRGGRKYHDRQQVTIWKCSRQIYGEALLARNTCSINLPFFARPDECINVRFIYQPMYKKCACYHWILTKSICDYFDMIEKTRALKHLFRENKNILWLFQNSGKIRGVFAAMAILTTIVAHFTGFCCSNDNGLFIKYAWWWLAFADDEVRPSMLRYRENVECVLIRAWIPRAMRPFSTSRMPTAYWGEDALLTE